MKMKETSRGKYKEAFDNNNLFLNPERVSLPDIDTDVATRLRPYIIRYLKWKYGEKAVCSIATENTYGAKGAIQMAGRERSAQLYGKSKEYEAEKKKYYEMTIKISDMVPEKPGIKLSEVEADIRAEFGSNPEAMLVLDRAKLLEGRIYGTGVHAGGVVISDNDNVNEYIPLAWNEAIQVWAAQCNMVRLEERGMLKMDLLGLSTLDVISDCVQMVEKYHGVVIDLDHIPFEKEVFREIYAKGLTNSVFQFESPGMKSMLVDFRPDCFEDLILLVAAYRPGPMQYLKGIIEVKNGRKEADYLVPHLKPILSATYSAIIYQEQVMQIFQSLAGYSLGMADLVRRAMSKKKTAVLEKERESFVHGDPSRGIKGCAENGISEKIANTLFDQVMDFAKYCFNKSHAAAYAFVSYQTAWLKYHYPAEFLCAMFNNKEMDKYEPIYSDCREFGIRILPPDVNYSFFDFILEGKAIRYGLKGIKGIGGANEETINAFVEKRTLDFYLSFPDFLSRNLQVEEKKVSVLSGKLMETLIKVGVFDSFCRNRKSLLEKLQSINNIEGENAEFTMKELLNRVEIEPLPADQSVNWENETELLGAILSEDPLSDYGDDSQYGCIPISQMTEGECVRIFGLVTKVEQKKSSKGNPMILLRILGKDGTCLVYLMNRLYTRYENENLQNQILYVNGVSGGDGRVFADEIGKQSKATGLYELILDSKEDTVLAKEVFAKDSGGPVSIRILFYYLKDENGYQKSKIPKVYRKSIQETTVQELRKNGLRIREYSSKIV